MSSLVQLFGLAPHGKQAIIWTNDDPGHWHKQGTDKVYIELFIVLIGVVIATCQKGIRTCYELRYHKS